MGRINKCPWEHYEVLSYAPHHKVKRIVVEPKRRLSLQRHRLRNEHWFVVAGEGQAVIDIPILAKHRVQNSSQENLVIIEVQTGEMILSASRMTTAGLELNYCLYLSLLEKIQIAFYKIWRLSDESICCRWYACFR
jgi:mannose-6-phosphate isomerase